MIVVKVELWPSGFPDRMRELGRIYITNDGHTSNHTDGERGSYDVSLMRKGRTNYDEDEPTRVARVENHPRNSEVVWKLVLKAIRALYPKWNID